MEWSAVDPDIIYFLNGNQLAKFNKTTNVVTTSRSPNGDPVTIMSGVGQTLVCRRRTRNSEHLYKIYCLNPVTVAEQIH
jgi:hypothetical protein